MEKFNEKMEKITDYAEIAVAIFSTALLSSLGWFLPIQLFAPEFHGRWLAPSGGEFTFWLAFTWFLWGGVKVIAILHREGKVGTVFFPGLKPLVMAPFAPLMNFRLRRPYFHDGKI